MFHGESLGIIKTVSTDNFKGINMIFSEKFDNFKILFNWVLGDCVLGLKLPCLGSYW